MHFFFYGTLLAGSDNPASRAAHRRLGMLRAGWVRGRLYAVPDPLGCYPALVPGGGTVRGIVYHTLPGFGRADLALLDGWEDCDPRRPARSLYRRCTLPVREDDGAISPAQAYVFRRPLPQGSHRIAGGDFAAWLTRKGASAYRPAPNPLALARPHSKGARFNDTNSNDQPG